MNSEFHHVHSSVFSTHFLTTSALCHIFLTCHIFIDFSFDLFDKNNYLLKARIHSQYKSKVAQLSQFSDTQYQLQLCKIASVNKKYYLGLSGMLSTMLFSLSSYYFLEFNNSSLFCRSLSRLLEILPRIKLTAFKLTHVRCFMVTFFLFMLIRPFFPITSQGDSTIISRSRSAEISSAITRTKRFTSSFQYFLLNYQ